MVTMATIMSSRFVKGIRASREGRGAVEPVHRDPGRVAERAEELDVPGEHLQRAGYPGAAPDGGEAVFRRRQAVPRHHAQDEGERQRAQSRDAGYLESFKNANDALDRIQKNLEDYPRRSAWRFRDFTSSPTTSCWRFWRRRKRPGGAAAHGQVFDGTSPWTSGRTPSPWTSSPCSPARASASGTGKTSRHRQRRAVASSVEAAMIVAQETRQGLVRVVPEGGTPKWVLKQPAQIVIMVSQIYWCRGVIECLESGEPVSNMLRCLEKNRADLKDMTVVVRGQLNGLPQNHRALITIDVHARHREELHEAGTRARTISSGRCSFSTTGTTRRTCARSGRQLAVRLRDEYLGAQSPASS